MKLKVNQLPKWLLMVATLLLCNMAWSQRTITGTVTDGETGEPLIGANILILGTSNGTVTDFDGNYTLEIPEDATEIEFTYTGYAAKKIALDAVNNVYNVVLSAGELLDEVVVIGYGSVKKDDATGSVLAVGEEDFNKGALVSADNLITGKVAGVQVTPSAAPGQGASIRIRGGTTTGNNEPLYVIDGVPIGNGANLAFYVNPADVETFTILKDASATAIYGSRGANGVVMITTKRGSKGAKPRITYDGFASLAYLGESVPMLSPDEFRNVVTFRRPDRLGDVGPERTDWYDEVTRTAFGQSHNLSVMGGGENIAYRFSGNYQDVEGVLDPYRAQRIGFGVALDIDLMDSQFKVRTNIKGNFNFRDNDRGVIGDALRFDPTQPVTDFANTTYGGFFEYGLALTPRNPVSQIAQQVNNFEEFGSLANLELEYLPDFLPGFSAKVNVGYDIDNNNSEFFSPTTFTRPPTDDRTGNIFISNGKNQNLLLETYLTYKFNVGVDHALYLYPKR
ncbi:MAG: SusC/RagA family TonB-linked outer membrane protein [Bacteroidota bacterium]